MKNDEQTVLQESLQSETEKTSEQDDSYDSFPRNILQPRSLEQTRMEIMERYIRNEIEEEQKQKKKQLKLPQTPQKFKRMKVEQQEDEEEDNIEDEDVEEEEEEEQEVEEEQEEEETEEEEELPPPKKSRKNTPLRKEVQFKQPLKKKNYPARISVSSSRRPILKKTKYLEEKDEKFVFV